MAIIEEDDHQQKSIAIKSSPQSQSVRTLPTEIVIEVLLKLPVEPLLICKAVCKSWRSLISDPHFVKSHLNLSAHPRLIFSVCRSNIFSTCCLKDVMNDSFIYNGLEVVDYPLKGACKWVSVVGSCNGLLCLEISTEDDGHILSIWNPSTRKQHNLESPACKNVFFGFGYEDSSDDYKVVSVSLIVNKGRLETLVKMYSLRNGSWKDIGAFPYGTAYMEDGKFVNGAFHWLASDGNGHWKIISLDLATETYGEVLHPVFDEGKKYMTLGILGERLCVLCHYPNSHVDLWAMKAYGVKESWTKLLSVPNPGPALNHNSAPNHNLAPLCISDDERKLLTYGEKLMIYDSENRSFSDVKSFDKYIQASTFAESLVSPMPPSAPLGPRIAASNG